MPDSYFGGVTLKDKATKTSAVDLYFAEADITDWIADHAAAGPVHDWLVAVLGCTLLTNVGTRVQNTDAAINPAPPTDDQAYRSSKLTVFYHDATSGGKFHFSIPGRDTTKYNTYPRSKDVILTIAAGGTAAIEALITATNAGKTPDGGNAVVDQIVVAGGRQG